jgi:hypothetical protein
LKGNIFLEVLKCNAHTIYRMMVGKSEGKRPLGRLRYRWEDNIKMDLRDRMAWYGLD